MIRASHVVLVLSLSLTGCASFIARHSGEQPVANETGNRSLGQIFVDSSIERNVKVNTYKLDTRFNYARINVNSFHGVVLLTGQVQDQYLKQLIEDNVKSMREVIAVHNYITIGEKIPYNRILDDTRITAAARAAMVASPVLSDSKVKAHTENGVLYVMGRLNTQEVAALNEALQKVEGMSSIITLIDNLDQIQTEAVIMSTNGNDVTPVATPQQSVPVQNEQLFKNATPEQNSVEAQPAIIPQAAAVVKSTVSAVTNTAKKVATATKNAVTPKK